MIQTWSLQIVKELIFTDYYSILPKKIDLRRKDKNITLSNLSIYYTLKNIKKSYQNNKFKILAATRSEEFKSPDGSYSISDIQDYIEYIYILEKYGEKTVNPLIKIYINKIENQIIFNINRIQDGWSEGTPLMPVFSL